MNLPNPGDRKVEVVDIYQRIRDKPDNLVFDHVYNPTDGWIIDNYSIAVHTRFGNTTGPSAVRNGANANVLSSQEVRQKQDELNKFYGKLRSDIDQSSTDTTTKQNKLNLLSELQLDYTRNFEILNSYSSLFNSTLAGLHITSTCQAVWHEVFGIKIYTSGGYVDAHVSINLLYIGNQAFLDAYVNQFKTKLEQIANA